MTSVGDGFGLRLILVVLIMEESFRVRNTYRFCSAIQCLCRLVVDGQNRHVQLSIRHFKLGDENVVMYSEITGYRILLLR
jgi:hypothetical protein